MLSSMSQRRPHKPSKSCYFCGRTGNITEEHAWPRWLGRGADVEPTQTTRTLGFSRVSLEAYSEAPTREVTKQGSVLTTRLRQVCRNCNGGWMSQLEEAVRPVFERMWEPEYPLGFTALSPREIGVLAAWAVKTAWVREQVGSGSSTPTPEMRRTFTADRVPPAFTSVWAARHTGQSNFGVYVLQVEARHQDRPLDGRESRNVLVCSLTFRGISLLVRTDDGWGVPRMTPPGDRWAQVWPSTGGVAWPPPQSASDDDLLEVVGRISHWMSVPELPKFHRHPGGVVRIRRN
ncbi:MAG: hypothetical protein JWM31_1924 [Solirubrobacterales bacterium]|nr:hypothetical protein [Solirubrobacterales bacterium]